MLSLAGALAPVATRLATISADWSVHPHLIADPDLSVPRSSPARCFGTGCQSSLQCSTMHIDESSQLSDMLSSIHIHWKSSKRGPEARIFPHSVSPYFPKPVLIADIPSGEFLISQLIISSATSADHEDEFRRDASHLLACLGTSMGCRHSRPTGARRQAPPLPRDDVQTSRKGARKVLRTEERGCRRGNSGRACEITCRRSHMSTDRHVQMTHCKL